jgi:hypothetical protein
MAQYSDSELLAMCDTLYPNTGVIRSIAVLDTTLALNQIFTVDAQSNELTFTTAQAFQTGTRVKFTTTTTIPTPLVAGADYFLIRTSGTVFKVADTLANAIANNGINLQDAGQGTLKANEQPLSVADPLSVILSKEFPASASYATRPTIADVGAAAMVDGIAQKSVSITLTNSGNAAWVVGGLALIRGGTATIGDLTGYFGGLELLSSPSIAVGESKTYTTKLTVSGL